MVGPGEHGESQLHPFVVELTRRVLTERQRHVYLLRLRGYGYRRIGHALAISPTTAEEHAMAADRKMQRALATRHRVAGEAGDQARDAVATVYALERGADAMRLAVGHGGVWVAAGGMVRRIDPETDEVVTQVRMPGVQDVAIGAGSVWVADRHEVTRLDPDGEPISRMPLDRPARRIVADDEAVWVIMGEEHESRGDTLARIDPRQDAVVDIIRLRDRVGDLAAGDGGVWLVSVEPEARVRRMEAGSHRMRQVKLGDPEETGVPRTVAAGVGEAWVGLEGSGQVRRVRSDSLVTADPVSLGGDPADMAVDARGVWVARRGRILNSVCRVDPESHELADTVPVHGRPSTLAVGEGAVWVSTSSGLSRIRAWREQNNR
jgi:DNA-binding CsgD family transcriptional regulator